MRPLGVGDIIEVSCPGLWASAQRFEVIEVMPAFNPTVVLAVERDISGHRYECQQIGPDTFTRLLGPQDFYLYRWAHVSRPKAPSIAPAPAYGATCTVCNEHNPYTEARPDFRCYGCRR